MSFYASNNRILVTKPNGSTLFDTNRPMLFVVGSYTVPSNIQLYTYISTNTPANPSDPTGAFYQSFSGVITSGISTYSSMIMLDLVINSKIPVSGEPGYTTNGQRGSNFFLGGAGNNNIDFNISAVNSFQIHQTTTIVGTDNSASHVISFNINSSGQLVWQANCAQRQIYNSGSAVSSAYRMRAYTATLLAGSTFYFLAESN